MRTSILSLTLAVACARWAGPGARVIALAVTAEMSGGSMRASWRTTWACRSRSCRSSRPSMCCYGAGSTVLAAAGTRRREYRPDPGLCLMALVLTRAERSVLTHMCNKSEMAVGLLTLYCDLDGAVSRSSSICSARCLRWPRAIAHAPSALLFLERDPGERPSAKPTGGPTNLPGFLHPTKRWTRHSLYMESGRRRRVDS